MFYKSFIESSLCFSFICWYFNLSVKNKNSLQKIVCVSSKIIGDTRRAICKKQVLRKACSISVSGRQVLYPMLETMLSRHCFTCPTCKTNRKKSSFIPVAISHFNDMK